MKKFLLVFVLTLFMVIGTYSLVSANGGPHGGYTATTDACAGCHRTHTAPGPRLLLADSTYDLCVTCHGSAGAGANTNVDDGFYLSSRDDAPGGADGNVGAGNTPDNAPLLGGGFLNYQGTAVTSIHDADGTTAAAWGNDVDRGVTADLTEGNLSCASCHDPHGSSNYRILKEEINGNPVVVQQVDEGAAKDYDTEQWGTGMSSVCAACHDAYHVTTSGSGSDSVYLATGGYTHAVDMNYSYGGTNTNPELGWTDEFGNGPNYLPLAESGINDRVVCSTCHLSHGTAAEATGFADGAYDPPFGTVGPIPSGDSALLRLDNRGVCEVCHQK
ncbi:hypothetical protein MNBD_CHLOROFLEXI01-1457 [hydrothermal vent metagenome]|uniref:Doubled CXXCH motif domain-containing protein n=1 Tax=hydrothermal vent metagenome TaxID=652676 RepID=A0A3B0VVN8_9ZZZZ